MMIVAVLHHRLSIKAGKSTLHDCDSPVQALTSISCTLLRQFQLDFLLHKWREWPRWPINCMHEYDYTSWNGLSKSYIMQAGMASVNLPYIMYGCFND